MLIRRLSLVAFAAVFAASSSFAMLQTSRPALADQDDHKPRHHQRADRDDRVNHNHPGQHWVNGQWVSNNPTGGHWVNGQWVPNTRSWTPGKHKGWKHKKRHDRDHDGR